MLDAKDGHVEALRARVDAGAGAGHRLAMLVALDNATSSRSSNHEWFPGG
jgi:hypothetical protein